MCHMLQAHTTPSVMGNCSQPALRLRMPPADVCPAAGQRERMLAATERMQKTSDRLHVGKQQLAETEVRAAWGMDAGARGRGGRRVIECR